ncbi:MAG: hypothetical protein GF383_11130 [Candidatus Lokiarchaeota archaeon]|nr:hypothetical protein [Candidatus Lokiarchaeota archaeon]MBD3341187.1 hypothetical protein [Candidatus Lokiarchaeota archaeon]
MKISIAQIIALTSYGNAFLKGQSVSFDFSHSTAKHCKKITFIEWPGGDVLADNPNEWFEFLKTNQVNSLFLDFAPAEDTIKETREAMGFIGGGGRWLISAIKGENAEVWEGRWSSPNEKTSENELWTVNYGRIAKEWSLPSTDKLPTLAQAKKNLKNALDEIISFSQAQKLDEFTKSFESALNCISSNNPFNGLYHQDLIVKDNYTLEAKQLLAACQAAFVFGAMASWNDMTYEGTTQESYDKLSDNLFFSIIESICIAINSFP